MGCFVKEPQELLRDRKGTRLTDRAAGAATAQGLHGEVCKRSGDFACWRRCLSWNAGLNEAEVTQRFLKSRKASKKAATMRFAPSAPQRLCVRTTCRASGGKGLVSRRDAEAQRSAGPRTGGFFCDSLRFLRPSVPPVIEAKGSHAKQRGKGGRHEERLTTTRWVGILPSW